MGEKRTSVILRAASSEQRAVLVMSLLTACCLLLANWAHAAAPTETAASYYDPAWAGELNWASQELWAKPTGASAWLENEYTPWWQNQVASPIQDYSPDKLATGAVRLDTALESDIVFHRPLTGWNVQPSGVSN